MVSEQSGWRGLWRLDAMLLGIAAVAGITGAVLANRYLGASAAAAEASLRGRYETRGVVVAATDLSPDLPLDATRLAVRQVPREFLPADAVPAERAGELLGSNTAIPISRGSLVVPSALRRHNPSSRLASALQGPRRALTIMVDQVNSQAGNLMPGDWVDLYYSRTEGNGGAVLVPLLQRVEILAAGASLRDAEVTMEAGGERHFSTITLGLSGEDATRVLLAQQSGVLSVVLRSAEDHSPLPLTPRNSRELLLPPVQRPRTTRGRVELLVGGNGSLAPTRSWLAIGQAPAGAAGDAS